MSRIDGRYVDVIKEAADTPTGFCLRGERVMIRVTGVVEHFREWIGVLSGEVERDIWRVNTAQGSCELHHLHLPTALEDGAESDVLENGDPGYWSLFRWDD